jgi:hypothetical protein
VIPTFIRLGVGGSSHELLAVARGWLTPIAVIPAWRPLRTGSGDQIDGEHAIANVT